MQAGRGEKSLFLLAPLPEFGAGPGWGQKATFLNTRMFRPLVTELNIKDEACLVPTRKTMLV